jgi:hypothetical protein
MVASAGRRKWDRSPAGGAEPLSRPGSRGLYVIPRSRGQFLIRYGQVVLGEGRRVGLALVTTYCRIPKAVVMSPLATT